MKKVILFFIINAVLLLIIPQAMGQVFDEEFGEIGFEQAEGFVFDAGPDRFLSLKEGETGGFTEPRTMLFETNELGMYSISVYEPSGLGLPHPNLSQSLFFVGLKAFVNNSCLLEGP